MTLRSHSQGVLQSGAEELQGESRPSQAIHQGQASLGKEGGEMRYKRKRGCEKDRGVRKENSRQSHAVPEQDTADRIRPLEGSQRTTPRKSKANQRAVLSSTRSTGGMGGTHGTKRRGPSTALPAALTWDVPGSTRLPLIKLCHY